MTSARARSHLLILLTNVIFGVNTPLVKYLLSGRLTPDSLTAMRILFPCVLFWTVSLFLPKEKVSPKDLFLLFVCGMLGIVMNQWIFVSGLRITSPVDAAVIVTSVPIIVMVLSFFFLKETLSGLKIGGVLTGAAGAVWLVLLANGSGASAGSASLRGNLMVLGTSLLYSVYFVISKPLTLKYSACTIMKWMFFFSLLMAAPFLYDDFLLSPAVAGTENSYDYLACFYVVFFATFLAYFLIPMALRHMRPTTVSMYNYIQPVIATVIAIIYFDADMTWQKIASALLIFSGVYMVTVSREKHALETLEHRALEKS